MLTIEWSSWYACIAILIRKAVVTALDSNKIQLVLWMNASAPLRGRREISSHAYGLKFEGDMFAGT